MNSDDEDPDDWVSIDIGGLIFRGVCTCEHKEEDHGWSSCQSLVTGDCPCRAGWEE